MYFQGTQVWSLIFTTILRSMVVKYQSTVDLCRVVMKKLNCVLYLEPSPIDLGVSKPLKHNEGLDKLVGVK
jgi:hypothetical protein